MSYTYLRARREGPVAYLTLNRPEVRNAFNEILIEELTHWAEVTATDSALRVLVIDGAGPVFCAGADLGWMAQMAAYSREENVRDAAAAGRMYQLLDELPVAVIGRIHGAALGGGAGLAAVCDIAVAEDRAMFGFTEVRLGIIPAVISPFVVSKIGGSVARELFLSGRRFDASRAREIGLVHAVVPSDQLDSKVREYVNHVLASGPEAVASAKQLIAAVRNRSSSDVATLAAEAIATRRASAEGQEGLRAFLEKRPAGWDASR